MARPGRGATLTWGQIAQELINYGRWVGLIGKDMKASAGVRGPEVEGRMSYLPSKSEVGGGSRNQLWKEGVK